ncbi:MAG: response regulator transcription factor [Planctomycetota bacterium]
MRGAEEKPGSRSPGMGEILRRLRGALERLVAEVATSVGSDPSFRECAGEGGVAVEVTRGGIVYRLSCRRAAEGSEEESPDLSPREFEIALLAVRGARNVDIARELKIRKSTVAAHLRNIYRKWGVASRVELVQKYLALAEGTRGN